MPKFTIGISVTNSGDATVTAYVGASLVGVNDYVEYYNTSEDYQHTFKVGTTSIVRYLTSDLGAIQKYNLYVVLWSVDKPIGHGTKYASAVVWSAVEKKKKKIIKLAASISSSTPTSFFSV